MEYLLPYYYEKLIYKVLSHHLDSQQTSNLFYSELQNNKAHNPNFESELEKIINELESNRKKIISANLEPDNDGHIDTELANGFIPFSMIFNFWDSGEYVSEYDENVIVSNDSLDSLKNGFQTFKDTSKEISEDRYVKKGIKIKWNGDLKQFAELIDSLEKNNWITINDGELSQNVKAICEVFDFSQTKRKENSDSANNLIQYLKPSERDVKIYTKKYPKKFNSILPNNKEK